MGSEIPTPRQPTSQPSLLIIAAASTGLKETVGLQSRIDGRRA